MDSFITTMTARARRLGVSAFEREELWRERVVQDVAAIQTLRSAESAPVFDIDAARGMPQLPVTRSAPSWELGPGQTVTQRVERALALIEEHRALNAFTAVFAERAHRHARQLDINDSHGVPRGPLHGAVLAVKDLMAVRGHRATAGTRAFDGELTATDALVLQRLTAAGAVLVGATNLHALAFGPFSTSSDWGVVGNVLRSGAVAGGSSGGSGSAIASGSVDIALGTDTAGSIRIPGAACGVVGLKGTFGSAPTDGVHPLAPTLDHVGPMTRTVRDAALAWSVMCGEPIPTGVPTSLETVVIGEPSAFCREYLDPPVEGAFRAALDAAVDLGAQVVPVDVPRLHLAPALMLCSIGPEALQTHLHLLRYRADELPPDVRLRLEMAMLVSEAEYERAQCLRQHLRDELEDAMAQVDVLMLPTLPIATPLVTQIEGMTGGGWPVRSAMSRLTAPFNLTGQPALTLPWGADPDGGGIGVQIVGGRHREQTVLQIAAALEATRTMQARGDGPSAG